MKISKFNILTLFITSIFFSLLLMSNIFILKKSLYNNWSISPISILKTYALETKNSINDSKQV